MDPIALIFYAIICGLLGYVAPNFSSPALRIIFGAIVGLAAAFALPLIKALL